MEPFAYEKDLGFSHQTTAGAVATIHSAIDALDAIGWTPWYNAPLFYLYSNISEAGLTLVTWLFGNAWLAIKIVQVLELVVAVSAGVAMYATQGRSRFWGLVFGLTYAVLPATALAIRGNLAMGWLAALPPAAIAGGTILLRRYGARAVPLVGFVSGFVGYGIALEYAVFSSLPLFALIVSGERKRISPVGWVLFVPLGVLCCAAVGAFYVLPSFSNPVFSNASARTVTLVTGAFLENFSETWAGLLTLVPREAYVSAFPEYNAGPVLPYFYVFGAVLWVGALGHLVRNRQRATGWTDYASILIVVSCAILAMGTMVPFGRNLWDAILVVPHLDAIRTTDRFLLVPAILATFWYVSALERIAASFPFGKRVAGWISIAVVLGFVSFDFSQHCFAVDPSKGIRQPQIDAVQSVVEAQGGRTASFAGVNGGWSFEEASEYGVPLPTAPGVGDLGWRFMKDGNGSVGVLGRMGVRTIISAPDWTRAPEFPNTSTIFRRLASAQVIFQSPEDVLVSRIDARPDVSAPTGICVYGGPGGFDVLENTKALQRTAFLERSTICRGSGFVNFDPRDLFAQQPGIEAWAGSTLIPAARKILDSDYPFVPNRTLLNVPWYRNSIDGDGPLFDTSGAVEIATAQAFVLPTHGEWPAGTTIGIRVCSHVGGTLLVDAERGRIGSVQIAAAQGFRWYEVHATGAMRSDAAISLTLQPASQDAGPAWTGFALDGVAVSRRTAAVRPPQTHSAFVAVSLDRFERRGETLRNATVLTPNEDSAFAGIATNMHYGSYHTVNGWLADAATSQVQFSWTGPAGLYVVQAQTALTKPGDVVGIDATKNGTCCRLTASNGTGFPGSLEGRFWLRKHSIIVVRLVSPDFNFDTADRINAVKVIPVGQLDLPLKSATGRGGIIDFQRPFEALSQLASIRHVNITSGLAHGTKGSLLEATTTLSGHPNSVALQVVKVGQGQATVALACDGVAREISLAEDDTSVALSGRGFVRCSVRVRWSSGEVGIRLLRLTVGGASVPESDANVWVPAGKYQISLLEADGRVSRQPVVNSDGCVGADVICTFPVTARHRIRLGETPAAARLLMFMSLRPSAALSAIHVKRTAALRWDVALAKTADIEVTQLYDRNWILTNGLKTYVGERCDITNTCFLDVPPGRYRIYHRWPSALRAGFAITIFSVLITVFLVLLKPRRGRPLAD